MSSDHAPDDDSIQDDDSVRDNDHIDTPENRTGGGTVYADIDLPGYGDESDLPEELLAQAAEVEAEMKEARARLAEVPPEVVIINHAMGLYELAAIHLSHQPPRLPEAALSIDAFACLVEGLHGRLGAEEATLQDALSQIRLAFVQIKGKPTA